MRSEMESDFPDATVIYESETPSRNCNNCCNSVEYVELITPSLPSLQSAFRLSVVKPKPDKSKWLIGRKRERETEGCSHLDQSQSEVRLKQSKPGSLSTLNWKLFELSFIGSLYVFYECKRESRGTSKRVHKNTTNIIMTVNTLSTFITIKLWNYQVFRQFTKTEMFCPTNCIS